MAEKGIKTVWIDSDSVGVLGTKVYRDDVLIATVPFGTLFYNDPTAVVGVQYKYDVQAYTSSSESTDETLGVNMDYYTIAESGLTPIMTNFKVEDATPTQIHFDASADITGMTVQGFNISNYGEPDSIVIDLDGLGGYFTTARTHNYYNNEKIRLSNGDGTVYDFTYKYIENNIAKPTEGASGVYYVDGSVGSSGDGLSEGTAFKTLQEGINETIGAGGGIKIWVKAGVTYSEGQLNDGENGTATNPNVIEGYKTTIGDLDGVTYYTYIPQSNVALNNADAPLFDGGDRSTGTFYNYGSDNYYTWKNIQVTNYNVGFLGGNSSTGFIWDNVVIKDIGSLTANIGHGIRLNGNLSTSTQNRVLNSQMINCTGEAIRFNAIQSLIRGCKNYCNEAPGGSTDTDATTDYYYLLAGDDNIILDSLAYKDTPNGNGHNGHGFSMKTNSDTVTASYNLIDGCEAVGIYDSFEFRHTGVKYCVVKNGIARADIPNRAPQTERTGGISFLSGGSYNIAENMLVHDVDCATIWTANSEADTDVNIQFESLIANTVFADCNMLARCNHIETSGTSAPYNNSLLNCTITNIPLLFKVYDSNPFVFGANYFTNTIFDGVTVQDSLQPSTGWVYDYNDIWNSWATSIGTNSFNINPDLNASYQPQADFNSISVPKIDTINYDKDGNERQDPTTVGSVLSAEETPGVVIPDYYVALSGDNTDGLTEATAFNNISRVNTEINNDTFIGKTVAFKRGDTFNGQILFDSDSGTLGNEIVFTSYGTGNLPIINTVMPYTDGTWVEGDSNIWRNTSISYDPNRIIVDSEEILQGISYSALGTNVPDLTRWWRGDNGDGGTYVYLYSTTDPNLSDIEISNETYTIRFKNSSYAKIDSLYLKGGSAATISLSGATNITFTNCDVGDMSRIGSQCEENAVEGANIVVDNCRFDSKYTLDFSGAGTSDGTSNLGTDDGFSASSLKVGEIKNSTFINWGHSSINLVTNSGGTSEVDNVIMHGNTFTTPDLSYGGGLTLDRLTNNCEAYDNNFTGTKDSQINGNNNYIHDNYFNGCKDSPFQNYTTGYAVKVQNYAGNSHDNRIEDNTMIDCDGAGIAISGNNSSGDLYGNIFDGNDIQNCGIGSYSSNQGIQFDNNSSGSNDGNTFTNNNIYSPATSDTILYYGSYISVAQFNANNGDIHNHTITGNTDNI